MSEAIIPGPDTSQSMPIGQKAEDVDCYRLLGESFVIDDVMIDPATVKRIREFEPMYVPLLCRRLYKAPGGREIRVNYHVVGRCIHDPKEGYEDQAVRLEHVPRGFTFPPDKIHPLRTLWVPWKEPNWDGDGSPPDPEWANNTPPAVVHPGPWLVEQLKAVHKFFDVGVQFDTSDDGELHQVGQDSYTVDLLQEILDRESKRDEEICAAAISEARYRARHNWKQFKQAVDQDRWSPEPPDDRPTPFIDMGGSNVNR